MYNTGYDFFKDLCCNYGIEKAIEIAKDYLDLPDRTSNVIEYTFCCELYEIMRKTEEKYNG